MDKNEWINQMASDLMYEYENLELIEALEIASVMWGDLTEDIVEEV